VQLLANPDVAEQQPSPLEKEVAKTEEEEAEFSDHSDSWEVISRTVPQSTEKEAKEPEEEEEELHHATANDDADVQQQVTEEETQDQATEAAAVSEQEEKQKEKEEEQEAELFAYTSTPEEIHSDTDTYRTDELFRQGELDFYDPTASLSSPPAEGENAGIEGKYASSPQKSPSSTPTEDDDFIKLAAAIVHQHSTTAQDEFDNAEELAFKKYVVAPATATAAAVVGAAQAVINTSSHYVVTFADRLRFFAARFRAYVTNLRPTAHRIAGTMTCTVHKMARSIHLKAGPGVRALSIPLNGANVLANDVVMAVQHVVCTAATRARKGADDLSFKQLDWVKIGLAIATVGCASILWKVNAANARLTGRLAQREGELAELIARIVALQRNITSHRVPIIRHTTASTNSTTVGWPLLVQVI